MTALLDGMVAALRERCGAEVYRGFDAVPLTKKSDHLFTVAELLRVQADAAFPGGGGHVRPFTAQVRITAAVPADAPAARAEAHLYGKVCPVMAQLGASLCEVQEPVMDARLHRLLVRAVFRVQGLWLEGDA